MVKRMKEDRQAETSVLYGAERFGGGGVL